MTRALLLLALVAALFVAPASAVFDWGEMSNMNSKQTGDATFYGQDPDQVCSAQRKRPRGSAARASPLEFFFFFEVERASERSLVFFPFQGARTFFATNSSLSQNIPLFSFLPFRQLPPNQTKKQDAKGACSFNENFANTMSSSSWTAGTMVTIAMNHDQFNGGKGCGTCIMYRGVGGGVGVTPLSTTQWTMGIVNNQCPECHKGSIDQNINGDGRWNVEWFAVPCNVGDGKIKYSKITNLGPEYWALVVSNTRVPVKDVQIKVDGKIWVVVVVVFFGVLGFGFGLLPSSSSSRVFFFLTSKNKKRSLFLSPFLPPPPPFPPPPTQQQARGTPRTTPPTTSGSGPESRSTATGTTPPTSPCRSA